MATAFIFSSNIEVSGIEKDSNNLRVLCSPKIRATTERNASYLQFLETTGKFSLWAAIISVSSCSPTHSITFSNYAECLRVSLKF